MKNVQFMLLLPIFSSIVSCAAGGELSKIFEASKDKSPISSEQRAELNQTANSIESNNETTKALTPKFLNTFSGKDVVVKGLATSCVTVKSLPGKCEIKQIGIDGKVESASSDCSVNLTTVLSTQIEFKCNQDGGMACGNSVVLDSALNEKHLGQKIFESTTTDFSLTIKEPGYCSKEFGASSSKKSSSAVLPPDESNGAPVTKTDVNPEAKVSAKPSEPAKVDSSTAKPSLVGLWSVPCDYESQTDLYKLRSVKFDSSVGKSTTVYFADSACKEPLFERIFAFSYVVGEKLELSQGWKLDVSVSDYVLKIRNQDLADQFNEEKFCGLTTWRKDFETRITNLTCDGDVRTSGTKVYDLVSKSEESKVLFGYKGASYDGSSEVKRPVILDKYAVFVRQ